MNHIIRELKRLEEDFEFYPTTDEIIHSIQTDINQQFAGFNNSVESYSLLDCGAGDGRVLTKLKNGDLYAIEKSNKLIHSLPKDIYIVGTEFHQTTLIDKQVSICISNPPYSEYEAWSSKIISEANAKHVYLVIPQRWEKSVAIQHALNLREAEAKVIGSYDFLEADRKARAIVHVIHIKLDNNRKHDDRLMVDPFDVWFEKSFPKKKEEIKEEREGGEDEKTPLKRELTQGTNLIKTLVELYNKDMATLNDNFTAISQLDEPLLSELNVSIEAIKKALKQRISGLKNKYWKEFFSNYEVINKKLTESSRKKMLQTLHKHTQVEFTESNAYAITEWCIKNANGYFNSQLIHVVENLTGNANIKLYKSNQRVFKDEDWRYGRAGFIKGLSRYSLELRIIAQWQGGIKPVDGFDFDYPNGLSNIAHTTLNDLIVVANNLGFKCTENTNMMLDWSNNKNQNIMLENGKTLMNVKAFLNGNLHIKFNQDFIRKLNVEFGRLKGWLRSKEDAIKELGITEDQAAKCFNSNLQLAKDTHIKSLGFVPVNEGKAVKH